MKKKSILPLYFTFSISIFLLWTLGTWQLNKNFKISKNNENYQSIDKRNSLKLFMFILSRLYIIYSLSIIFRSFTGFFFII